MISQTCCLNLEAIRLEIQKRFLYLESQSRLGKCLIECANTLWKYVRAGYIAAADVQADLAQLQALPLQVISTAELMSEAVTMGLDCGISAYDGCYVALSKQVEAPLLTLDEKLVSACAKSVYEVYSFERFELPSSPQV